MIRAGRAGNRLRSRTTEGGSVHEEGLYLLTAALVAMLILVPTAMAQEETMTMERTTTMEGDLPKSGGLPVGSYLRRPLPCFLAVASWRTLSRDAGNPTGVEYGAGFPVGGDVFGLHL